MKISSDTPARNMIGNGTFIKGDVESNGDIRIDGQVIGSIRTNGKIVIGNNGIVEGEIFCKTADVSGRIKGLLSVEELCSFKSTSHIEGELKTKQLLIETGAIFCGKCEMSSADLKHEEKKK